MAAIYPKTMCQLVKLDYINYLNKMKFAPHQALADRYVVVHITGMLRMCALHP